MSLQWLLLQQVRYTNGKLFTLSNSGSLNPKKRIFDRIRYLFSFKGCINILFFHRWNLLRTFKRDIIVYIFVKIISHICIKTHFKIFVWNFNTFLDRKLRIFCFGHYLFRHCHSLSSFSSLSYFRVLSLWSPEVGDKTRPRPACTRYRCNTSLPGCVCSAKVKL